MSEPTKPLPERRQAERRKPMLVLESDHAIEIMKARGYTGAFIGHAHNGIVKVIEIVNPYFWDR